MNEFELIAKLTKDAPRKATGLVRGVGDDCAVIEGKGDSLWLISTDAMVQGIHFDKGLAGFHSIGRKALSVNLSDIAAMGGRPRFFLVSIGLPPAFADEAAGPIYKGMDEVAGKYNTILIGGDTVASPCALFISVTIVGEARRGQCLLRGGARPGDVIYVTGKVGGSGAGLKLLKAGKSGGSLGRFIERHVNPTPRVEEGLTIAASGIPTSMIDLSDGLLADLGHIALESGVGFEIEAEKVPCETGLDEAAVALGIDLVETALTGGEDYELVFTVPKARIGDFEKYLERNPVQCGVTRIGWILADTKIRTVKKGGEILKFDRPGFDHFG